MRKIALFSVLAACNGEGPSTVDLGAAVEEDALMAHLGELEAIGDANGSTRVSGSPGYAASVDYIVSALEDAGYEVTLDAYDVGTWNLESVALTVGGTAYTDGDEGNEGFEVFPYSGAGDVTANAVAVDVTVPPGAEGTSDSGCEDSDFDGFPSGSIALVQRGACTFATKVDNAIEAGASAVLLFNEGQTGRTEPFSGSLGEEMVAVPVIGISYAAGAAIVNAGSATSVHVAVAATGGITTEHNVLAELAGASDTVVMVGAHLDSVAAGPGINDNGSGTALVLETALQAAAAGWQPDHTVRFAWWGAEESGLIGSWHWAFDEDTEEFDAEHMDPLVAYLNYDMVASGNGYRFVYDGSSEGGGAEFEAIEEIYTGWFDERDMEYAKTPLFIPTDSYWFVQAGVPTGGLYSGAYEPMTQGWAAETGGVVGEALDACYHEACDLVENTNATLFGELGAAGAYAVQELAEIPAIASTERRIAPSGRDVPRPVGCHDDVHWDR